MGDYTSKELAEVLRLHADWRMDRDGGARANLIDADLRGADLRDAGLVGAYLRDADLRDADLRGADLRDAYLEGADLRGAYLGGADLGGANVSQVVGRSTNTRRGPTGSRLHRGKR